ncbi:MAG: bifunctional phosphoserine phosphatase/homoserine phosphotransferase ThrH [Spirochaetaceae bacterium]
MRIVCLDLEGVLVPEVWIAVAERFEVAELRLTTRDVSDYDELMGHRIRTLRSEGITLADIRETIGGLAPLDGAREFLDELRENTQVIILSDTFEQFASPLMSQLGRPTIFCNELFADENGFISHYRLRQTDGKRRAVLALRSIGFTVTAVGDSYNDLTMIEAADAGALFRPPNSITEQYPTLPSFEEYNDLLEFLLADTHADRKSADQKT